MKSTVLHWAYIGACLVIPAAWGALSAWLFSRRDQRASDTSRPPIDYMI